MTQAKKINFSYLDIIRFMHVHALEHHGDPAALGVDDPVRALLVVRVGGGAEGG